MMPVTHFVSLYVLQMSRVPQPEVNALEWSQHADIIPLPFHSLSTRLHRPGAYDPALVGGLLP